MCLLIALAYLLPLIAVIAIRETAWVLLTWVTLPHALRLVRDLRVQRGPALNRVLGATARLALWQAALFSLGLLVGSLWTG